MPSRAARGIVVIPAVFLAVALTSATARAAEPPPAIVALAIDASGSLTSADLNRTKALAAAILGSLPAGSEVAVFSFDDQSRLLLPRSTSTDEVRQAVDGIKIAGRFTALNDALYDASRYLRDAPPARKAIVLVTDGLDENSALHLDDALMVAQETTIPVLAVGVGRVQERVLRRIAKLTGGNYYASGDATGSLLASQIVALPGPAAPAAGAGAMAVSARQSRASGASIPAPRSGPAATGGASPAWLWAGLLVSVAVAGLFVLLARGRRKAPPCPTCGRKLSDLRSPCAFCAADPDAPTMFDQRPMSEEVSDTVMARMDLTEEYLEKTVTLREQPVLTITSGPGHGMVFTLNRQSSTSVGRAKANDIVLEDVSISSQHCRIRPEEGSFVVHDLKSTNGTFVNERRTSRHVLAEGDTIKIGETYLQFRLNQKRA